MFPEYDFNQARYVLYTAVKRIYNGLPVREIRDMIYRHLFSDEDEERGTKRVVEYGKIYGRECRSVMPLTKFDMWILSPEIAGRVISAEAAHWLYHDFTIEIRSPLVPHLQEENVFGHAPFQHIRELRVTECKPYLGAYRNRAKSLSLSHVDFEKKYRSDSNKSRAELSTLCLFPKLKVFELEFTHQAWHKKYNTMNGGTYRRCSSSLKSRGSVCVCLVELTHGTGQYTSQRLWQSRKTMMSTTQGRGGTTQSQSSSCAMNSGR